MISRALKTEERLTTSQWADRNRRLSSKASEAGGAWRTDFTPYLREPMDAQSVHHPSRESVLIKGTQIGGSECGYNAMGYWTDTSPGPGLVVMPTREMADSVAEQRLQPMFEDTPALAEKMSAARSRDGANNKRVKHYTGGVWFLRGANSAAGLGSNPIRFLVLDEVDKYPRSAGDEGDPVTLAKKRTTNFRRRKIFEISSPKIKGDSRITEDYEASTQGRYFVPCPHCEHEQTIEWDRLRYVRREYRELTCGECGAIGELPSDASGHHQCSECNAALVLGEGNCKAVTTDEVQRVWFECEACQGEIDEHHKTWMLENGRYIHAMPGPGEFVEDPDTPWAIWARDRGEVRRFLPTFDRPLGWHVSALYSPLGWFSWRDAVKQYLIASKGGVDAESGESLLQVFWNTVRGEAFELPGEKPDAAPIKLRAEPWRIGDPLPAWALMLVAAVDVQGNRIEVKVKGYGHYEESGLADYQVINGDPSIIGPNSVWTELEKILDKGYRHSFGGTLRILATAIDSGGHHTQEVYRFCSMWAHRNVFAVKGASKPGRPVISTQPSRVDINYRGKVIKEGAELWMIGTDTAKQLIYRRLAIATPGPGYMHFPAGLPDEYYDGLTAEKMVSRGGRVEWLKTRDRNEPLDLEVYCYAAALQAGLSRTNWDRVEAALRSVGQDLFVAAEQKQEAPAAAAVPGTTAPSPPAGGEDAEAAAAANAPPVDTSAHHTPPPRPRASNWVMGFR